MDFSKPITSLDEGKAFIEALHASGNLFHFEDSPEDCGNTIDGVWVPSWTPEEAAMLSDRRDELYDLDWAPAGHECPIGYALEVMDRNGDLA